MNLKNRLFSNGKLEIQIYVRLSQGLTQSTASLVLFYFVCITNNRRLLVWNLGCIILESRQKVWPNAVTFTRSAFYWIFGWGWYHSGDSRDWKPYYIYPTFSGENEKIFLIFAGDFLYSGDESLMNNITKFLYFMTFLTFVREEHLKAKHAWHKKEFSL